MTQSSCQHDSSPVRPPDNDLRLLPGLESPESIYFEAMDSALQKTRSAIPPLAVVSATLLGIVASVGLGILAGQTAIRTIWIIALLVFGFVILMSIGNRYWLLLPLTLALDLPAVPIGGRAITFSDLAIAACTGLYIVRLAMKHEKFQPLRALALPVYAYLGWVVFIYMKNPVGLSLLGSEMAGGREYIRLYLSFLAFFVISQQKLGEKEARWIIGIMVIGSILSSAWGIGSYFVFGYQSVGSDGGYYTWHQGLSAPAYAIALWIFCRYKPREIFSLKNIWMPFLLVCCVLLALYSGKRATTATMFLVPIIVSFFRKDYGFLTLSLTVITVFIAVLVMGHGSLFHLPLSTQRVLMNLPGNWDPQIKIQTEESADSFRAFMRERAWIQIQQSPIIGKGLGIHIGDALAYNDAVAGSEEQKLLLAEGSSWHSTWLGIWADFGFPPMVFFAIFCFLYLWLANHLRWKTSHGSAIHTLVLMLLVFMCSALLRSYTSGTAVSVGEQYWWRFAILLSLHLTMQVAPTSPQKKPRRFQPDFAIAKQPSQQAQH